MESRTQSSRPRPKKKIRGQVQPFREQTLSRPRTGMLEAKKGPTTQAQVFSKKKGVFKNIFQAISRKKRLPKKFLDDVQNSNTSKNSAVFEPRTG